MRPKRLIIMKYFIYESIKIVTILKRRKTLSFRHLSRAYSRKYGQVCDFSKKGQKKRQKNVKKGQNI